MHETRIHVPTASILHAVLNDSPLPALPIDESTKEGLRNDERSKPERNAIAGYIIGQILHKAQSELPSSDLQETSYSQVATRVYNHLEHSLKTYIQDMRENPNISQRDREVYFRFASLVSELNPRRGSDTKQFLTRGIGTAVDVLNLSAMTIRKKYLLQFNTVPPPSEVAAILRNSVPLVARFASIDLDNAEVLRNIFVDKETSRLTGNLFELRQNGNGLKLEIDKEVFEGQLNNFPLQRNPSITTGCPILAVPGLVGNFVNWYADIIEANVNA